MDIKVSEFKEDILESIAGRIMSIREASSKLLFIDLHGDESKV
jgi:lysyl-tRNA synthetase class II